MDRSPGRHSKKKLTLTQAFAQFGAELTNPRWQCSALAKDGSLVVSCWSHLLKSGEDGQQRYDYSLAQWGEGNRQGRELLWTHLRTAFDLKLAVRLVIATFDKREDADRPTTDASPLPKTFSTEPNLVSRVVEFDDEGSPSSFGDEPYGSSMDDAVVGFMSKRKLRQSDIVRCRTWWSMTV